MNDLRTAAVFETPERFYSKEHAISKPYEIPEMLTIRETAARTGLSYDFIRKLCLQRRIVFIRTGTKYLVNYDRFIDFLNEGEMQNEADSRGTN